MDPTDAPTDWVVGPPPDAPAGVGGIAREVVLGKRDAAGGDSAGAGTGGGGGGGGGEEDTLLLTGFPSGDVGAWVRATPASARLLLRRIAAHAPGPAYPLPDGSQAPAGVRALVLCSDGATVLSGGADGAVRRWTVKQTAPDEDWIAEVGVGGEKPPATTTVDDGSSTAAAPERWDGRLRLRLVPIEYDPWTGGKGATSTTTTTTTTTTRQPHAPFSPEMLRGGKSPPPEWNVCALKSPLRGAALGVRGLGVRCSDGTVVVGTDACDVWMAGRLLFSHHHN